MLAAIFAELIGLFRVYVIPLLFLLLTVVFLWGIVQFVSAGGNEDKLKNGKKHMLWGIVGLAVAIGMWGLANVLLNSFLIGGGGIPTFPR